MKKIITLAVIALGLMVSTNAYAYGYSGSVNLVGKVIASDQSKRESEVVVTPKFGNNEISNLINRINAEDVMAFIQILKRANITF